MIVSILYNLDIWYTFGSISGYMLTCETRDRGRSCVGPSDPEPRQNRRHLNLDSKLCFFFLAFSKDSMQHQTRTVRLDLSLAALTPFRRVDGELTVDSQKVRSPQSALPRRYFLALNGRGTHL